MTEPTAIVCLTGSELTRGETRDINGSFLAGELTALGFRVREILLVPDDAPLLETRLAECLERVDAVVISGGLGPTADDLTVAALARVAGRGVARDPDAREAMRQRALARVGSEDRIPANYYKQSEVVEGSVVLLNPVGLAPGCLVETGGAIAITLPGVPRELVAMFRERAIPELQRRYPLRPARTLTAKVFGAGESWVEERVQRLGIDFARLEYGISARPGEITLKLRENGDESSALGDARRLLEREFGDDLFVLPEGREATGASAASIVLDLLRRSGQTLATAESCTGGLIAAALTDVPGASTCFLGGIVAYDNRTKQAALGVDAALIEREGAVSEPVCEAMALGACRRLGADLAVAVTGIAGPGGGTAEKPVGLVYIGVAGPATAARGESPEPGRVEAQVHRQRLRGDRDRIRAMTTARALDLLRRRLDG